MSTRSESSSIEGAPIGLERLFPHCSSTDLGRVEHLPFLIGRVLEEGDRHDLHWLVRHCGEEAIAEWARSNGERQLSRRSRAFWAVVFDLDAGPIDENPLWPI